MKLGLINSAWAQAGRDTAYGIRLTKEIGFDSIDIFTDPLDIDVRERRRIKQECDQAGLPIVSIACVAVGLIDFNPSVQRFHIGRVEKYLDLAYEYEAKNVLLVIGEYIWEQQVIAPAEQWKTGVENVRRLGDYAAALGLEIALELEPFKLSLVNSIGTMVRFLDDVAVPAVKANIDVSHMLLSHTPPEELRALKGKACHVHISDCDGKIHGDLPPGRGVVDFPPYLQEIKALGIEGAISIELEYSPEPDRIVDWVTEAYRETDKLMRGRTTLNPSFGEPMRPWLLEELNYADVRQRDLASYVAVLPMGATEPHNYHLPYGNDFLTARRVGERICAAAHRQGAKVLLLPTIPFGVDSNLLKFPLTMHVSLRSLEAVLRDIVRSLECHGIHKLVLLNGHGGNELKPLLREWYGTTSVFATVVDWWKVGADKYSEIFEKPDDHAGEMETSVGLALYPELVRMELAADGSTRRARLEAVRRGWASITRPWHLLTESSGVGDPRAANREKGEQYLELVTERLATFLVQLSGDSLDEPFPFEK